MPREELFNYLRNIEDFDKGPLEAVLAQTEIIGEPAMPSSEDSAALAWVGAAFTHWETNFPLEAPLAASLRRLKPVLGMMALADNQFYTAGIHPLHEALDNLYDAAVGWQESAGRAGEPAKKLIEQTVDGAMACLEENGAGLMALLRETAKAAQRLQTRTRRMAQRTADAERGQLRAARAKEVAATMINSQLTRHPIPADIGEFLTGPWFESAQLVLLKYGDNSSQWQAMSATTGELMDTLAPRDGERGADDVASQVMQEVRRWLLSLQHDQELADEVLSTIEYTHLRVAKGVEIERNATSLIAVQNTTPDSTESLQLDGIETGQWFLVSARKGGMLRTQLAMLQQKEQRLLFCNHAGAKVQTMDFASFTELLQQGKASRLATGATFSRSLAAVVGVDTREALSQLTGEPMPSAEAINAVPDFEPRPATAQPETPAPVTPEPPPTAPRQAAAAPTQSPAGPASTPAPVAPETVTETPVAATRQPTPPPAQKVPTQAETPVSDDAPAQQAPEKLPPVTVPSEPAPKPDLPDSGIPELPMGTWLGFHDLDPPLLAKLAMHDKVRRLLIFVNRKGIELRRLSEDDYLDLLQQGQIDILETKTNFREQVERARQRMARHQT
ncbi:DUF1631 family protein [Pseudohalioglobus sediminis]|uniref:DUF1631 family protein n=1 Tax=Pseudohalioglobus sediminis TaxID=2606449 RepID=A0A5B0WUG0_9GAMM|nr:DUF1631 family protein [Pseudohalioglobus sediminis]KAA1189935.1 DUF1631 family protein [Pseudohalioglobus sediminis]